MIFSILYIYMHLWKLSVISSVKDSAFLYFNLFTNVFRKKLEEDECESRFEVDIGNDAASKVGCLRGCPQICEQ